jgi:hypothetical protein
MSPSSSGPSPPTELTAQLSQLRLTLEAPVRARSGEPVPLVFRVANSGREPVTLPLLGRSPTADFRVTDSRGQIIWTLLRGQTMLGALRLYPLEAGQTLTFRQIWNQRADNGSPVAPGTYLLRGVLLTDRPEGLASPAARLRIER